MQSVLQAVAVDYDGTLAEGDRPGDEVLDAIRECRAAGRGVVLVTGRILSELRAAFPRVEEEFDAIVAENGAVLDDADGIRDLAAPVDPELAEALAHRDVPLRQGRVLLACDAVHAEDALAEIARLGLDCQLARNRAALMILPGGVTKGSGLAEALGNLGISRHSTVGVGDAENDHALLAACELGVAVGNAVPSLQRHADLVLDQSAGAGVVELLRGPVLAGTQRIWPRRWRLQMGHAPTGDPVWVPASQINLLVTGASCAGKSYVVGLIAEQLARLGYSLLLIDREGDHLDLASRRGVVALGGREGPPSPRHLTQLLHHRFGSVVLDLSLLSEEAQCRYIEEMAPLMLAQRASTGLPHWVLIDEAHGLPRATEPGQPSATGYGYATYQPSTLPPALREHIDFVIVLAGGGEGRADALAFVAELTGEPAATLATKLGDERGQALLVRADRSGPAVAFRVARRASGHVRHWHKYVHGMLPAHLRFYFHGDALVGANLREFHRHLGVCPPDAVTYHARRRDFSRWIGEVLSDGALAEEVARVEEQARHDELGAERLRQRLRAAIERRYLE
jgi:hydroxymethylpyrimidine pyrophosphatase-like HAD family hydrolase